MTTARSKLQIVQALESAAKILEAAGEDDELAGMEDIPLAPNEEPSLARFLDTIVFLETFELAKVVPDSPEWQKGLALAKLTQPAFLLDAAAYLEPLFSLRGFGKHKLKWKALAKPAMTKDRFQSRGTFLRNFIGELAARPQAFRDAFPDARLLAVARRLAEVSEVKTAPEALAILATIRTVGGMTRLRAWDREAVKESGVQVSEFDNTVAAVGEAQDLGKQLAATESALQAPQTASEASRLEAERVELRTKIETVAASSPAAEVVLALAAQAAQPRAYVTKTGEELGLDPQQEEAMIARGKVVVAAKAGSGKTRVIAGKVVYHVKELGVRPAQIMATSFSKKSGDELVERIRKYGGDTITEDSVAMEGFGTTHSIALKLLKRSIPRLKGRDTIIKDSGVKYLMKMAMQQVRMRPQQEAAPFDPNESFFKAPLKPAPQPAPVPTAPGPGQPQPVAPSPGPAGLTGEAAIKSLAKQALDTGRFGGWPRDFLTSLADRGSGTRSGQLSEKQAKFFLQYLRQAGIDPTPITGSVGGLLGPLDAGAEVQGAEGLDYFKIPANQWFNLGRGDDAFKDEKGRPLGPKQVGMYLTRWRADLVTPGQAAGKGMSDFAAAYGAYEWLKHSHPEFAGKIDFDDMLVMACQQLVFNPRLLAECQNRWKVILVDEAQDLNAAQHLLFGLIAGYYDPATQAPKTDGAMSADTFAFIGDDAQAIYGFRGADVELFIDKSDLVGGPFATKQIATNYRSGVVIVNAAGQLLKHNSKQIPMECKANEARKGQGFIHAVRVADHEAGAVLVADEVKDLLSSGAESLGESKGVPTFGIGVRTNAEAYDFAAEMLKRGIPFKSKVNFFNDKTTNAILNWMVIAADPENKAAVNEAILNAHDAPKFYLDKVFNMRLQELARGQNYLSFLNDGGWRNVYENRLAWKNEKNVLPYTKALLTIAGMSKTASPKEVLDVILNLKGLGVAGKPGLSMLDTLVEDAKDDPELLDTIREETEGEPGLEGQFTEDDVKALALAPIKPLIGLLEGYEDLNQAMVYIKKLQAANEKTDKGRKRSKDGEDDQEESVEPAVIIDTIHGWKGLEAKRMYIPMASGTFPHAKSDTQDAMEAERRLAYVAITRGQDRVTILAPDVNHQGREAGPSAFIREACIVLEGDEDEVLPVVPGAEPPGTTTAAFEFATAALEEAALLMGQGLATDDPGLATVSPEPEEHQEAPEDVLMTEPQEDADEDEDEALADSGAPDEEVQEEIAASEALARSQALMARLKH